MNFLDFLQSCQQKSISFALDGGALKVNAPPATLTPDVVALLRSFKPELLALLARAPQADAAPAARIQARTGSANLPASHGQEQLWLAASMDDVGDGYHFVRTIELEGELDLAALNRAFSAIVARHESLRTVFVQNDGRLEQVVQAASAIDIAVADLSALDAPGQRSAAAALQAQLARSPFDLARDTMLRLQLVRLGERRHLLILVLHHIASDGWSLGILIDEFQTLYAQCVQGAAPALAPLPLQYADYACWQRAPAQALAQDAALQFWRTELDGVADVHGLPVDRPRAPRQSFTGARLLTELDAATLDGLRQLAQRSGATLFMALASLFAALVARHARAADVVIGTPVANRPQQELEGLIGYFVNLLPLRYAIDTAESPLQLVARTRERVLAAFSHQDAPFDRIVQAVVTTRSASYSPLVQIGFVLQNNALPELALPGLACTLHPPQQGGALFDLQLEASESAAGLHLAWDYASDLFDQATIARMAGQFGNLVAGALAAPERALRDIDILDSAARHRLLVELNDTAADFPRTACMHQLFEEQAARTPDAVALLCGAEQLSYRDLNARANRLARLLSQERQVGPEVLVGVCLERSFEMVVAMLAVQKAGGAYVPMDPAYPPARLAYMVEDAAMDTVLTSSNVRALAALGDSQALCLDEPAVRARLEAYADDDFGRGVPGPTPASLAYVIYTSGSTGKPKGVMIEHRNAVALLSWAQGAYSAQQLSCVLASTSICFDLSVFELFAPLAVGGAALVVANILALERKPYPLPVTLVNTVPSAAEALLASDSIPASVTTVNLAGEPLKQKIVDALYQRGIAQVYDLYGPSEDTTYSTCMLRRAGASASIGRPIANTQVYLLDDALQLAPPGVAGELCIGGAGLARGYLRRPELTAEKFIDNPFGAGPGARLYRTGDLARWRADGNLEYLGRIDHQVKIRGFRIELGEIDNALASHPQVSDAVVLARVSAAGEQRLVAYVAVADAPLDGAPAHEMVARLRQHLALTLPDYMLPAAFVLMDALPQTANGKIDRKALPEPDAAQLQAQYAAPVSPTEQLLCGLWGELLGVERVGIHDNFFQLGGHSLLVMQLIARLQTHGRVLPVRQLFATPTLAELAAALDALDAQGSPRQAWTAPANGIAVGCTEIEPGMLPLVSLDPEQIGKIVASVPGGAANIADIYPLVSLQEGILFHHMLGNEGDPYVAPMLFAIRGRQGLADFIEAWQFVIDRHDVLRTAVLWEGLAQPVQVVLRAARLPVIAVDIGAGQDARAAMEALCASGGQRIDLRQAPLVRLQVAADPESDLHYVLLQSHHIIIDHISLELIQNEMIAYRAGQGHALPAPLPYRQFVAYEQRQGARADAEAYFRQVLGDVAEPTAPFQLIDIQGDGSGMAEARAGVPLDVAAALRRAARAMTVSPAALFHAAWALVVGACSGRDDVVFGTVVSGRLQGVPGAERMLGMFINTLPLRVRLAGGARALVQQVQDALVGLLPYEQAPLALAQRCSALSGGMPLFSAMLNYRHSAAADVAGIGQLRADSWYDYLGGQERTNYPFSLSVDDLGEAFALDLQVDASLDAGRIVGYMQSALAQLSAALLAQPEAEVAQMSVLPNAERRLLLEEWNATAVEYRTDRCLHQLVEAQAARSPHAVALVCGDQQLSYAELNARANRLAHYLAVQRNVKPDSLVGVCMERSLDMVVGILAILKAGGAYVPMDPAYPAARLAYMLGDAALSTVLTEHAVLARTPFGAAHALCLDDPALQSELAACRATDLAAGSLGLAPHHLAYVIYTSGSTGNPKGVMIEHRNAVSFLSWARDAFSAQQLSGVLAATSICFDLSVFEMFAPMSVGGAAILVGSILELQRGPHRLPVTLVNTVPSAAEALLARDCIPASVTTVNLAGEPLRQKIVDALYGRGIAQVYDLYGPSEDTTYSTCALRRAGGSANIGRPIANTEAYLFDRRGLPVPLGVAGELYLGGAGLARGYLNRPELTAEKFVRHPYRSGARLYRTGDLVRYGADGRLEFLGRIDHQVKIRGFRIELGEIEHALASYPSVDAAVVVARQALAGDLRLVAYVAGLAQGQLDQLRAHLGQTLPEYMVPSAFVLLDRLPLTPNGKVDRKALPEPEAAAQAVHVVPRTAMERRLCAVWQEVLGIERVGATDNFFQLGGHSLLVMQVIARLQQDGVALTVRQLFALPLLADLAAALDAQRQAAPDAPRFQAPPNLIPAGCKQITPQMLPLVALDAGEIASIVAQVPGGAANVQDIYPLAPLQEGILFHHMLRQHSDPYVMPGLFAMQGRAQLDAFVQALQCVIDRHDVLRTALLWKDLSVPVQVVWRSATLAVDWLALDPARDARVQMEALCAPEKQWMDLGAAPLVRLQVAADPRSERHFVLLQAHHIIADHITLELIVQELAAIHAGRADTLPARLPYREFVAHELHKAERDQAQAYFTGILGDVEETTAPFNLLDVRGDGAGMAEATQPVAASLAQRIGVLARAMGVSPAAVFHAAWALVVGATSARSDVVFGTVVSGRLQGAAGAQDMLGMFINTLPLRVRLEQASAGQLVRQVHASLTDLLPFEQASLALAQRCSGMAGGAPLFSAMLNYRHSAPAPQHELAWFELLGAYERSSYPLDLSVDDTGAGFSLTLQVDAALDPDRILDAMQTALASLAAALETQSNVPARTLPLLAPAEQALLAGWSSGGAGFAQDRCIHHLVERQAARTPDALALVCGAVRLTYAELNARANRIAHFLGAQRRVGPGVLVGICLPRSGDLVASILGVLKAGAAYVPLDPDYPQARLAYMVGDAGLDTVLTHVALRDALAVGAARSLCLDEPVTAALLGQQPDVNPAPQASGARALAYVIYTSGSTGNPKGVMVEHGPFASHIQACGQAYGLGAHERILQFASINFDAAQEQIFTALASGAALYLRSEGLWHGADFFQFCLEHGITVADLPPAYCLALLEDQAASARFFAQAPLKLLILGGEALSAELVRRWRGSAPSCALINAYGPTEAVVTACYYRFDAAAPREQVPIGRPMAGRQCLVLVDGQLAPQGVAGELHLGGIGLARGYLHRDDLTADKFIANPFYDAADPCSSERLYKTGDMARWLADGNLECLGRIDDQVKIRGYRIELGEVASALAALDQVGDSAVLARAGGDGEMRLVAYVVAAELPDGERALTDRLRAQLEQALPGHMVPAQFVLLGAMPITPNGKVDRKALALLGGDVMRASFVAPRSPTEQRLCQLWQEVLGLERVGIDDNFFELGGHSLSATRLVTRVNQAFSLALPLTELFNAQTVALLARAIDAAVLAAALRIDDGEALLSNELELSL